MQEKALFLINYVLFTLLACVLIAAQSGLLKFDTAAPILWVPLLVYWVQFRSFTEALCFSVILAHVLFAFTVAPIKVLFVIVVSMAYGVRLIRSRVLWSGAIQFATVCGLACIALPFVTFGTSFVFESQTQKFFLLWETLLNPPITALFALPLFLLFLGIDHLTNKEHPKTAESEAL